MELSRKGEGNSLHFACSFALHLKYAAGAWHAWCPYRKGNIKSFERIRRQNTVSAGLNSEPQAFMDVIQDLMLVQHVEEFTRSREGQRPSLLDCVFTNDENSIDEIVHRPAVGKSDHDCLIWTYLCRAQTIQSKKEKLNYNKGDYNAMKSQFANTV